MDNVVSWTAILEMAGAIGTVGGAWLVVRKISKDIKKDHDIENAKILHAAKEEIAKARVDIQAVRAVYIAEFTARLLAIQTDLDSHKDFTDKEFEHIRETYNGEIRNLGQKIEDLRSELRNQHGQLVGLLTKMIHNRD